MGVRIGHYTTSERLRKRQEYGLQVVLDPNWHATQSVIVTVLDTPVLLQAFGIPPGVTLDVWSVYGSDGAYETPFLYHGQPLQLTQAINPILLGFTGRYRLKPSGPIPGVTCVAIPYNTYGFSGTTVEQPNGAQQQRPNLLFGPDSNSPWSVVVEVDDTPLVLTAYGLTGFDTVDMYAAYKPDGSVLTEYKYDGVWRRLSVDNNPVVLEQTGRYRLFLNAPLGTVLVVAHPTGTGFTDPYGAVQPSSGVSAVVAGTGISVNNANPAQPVVSLDGSTQSSIASALQPGDNISLLNNDAGYTTNTGTLTAVGAGTGIAVDSTNPAQPSVALDSATQASLGLADSALQAGDNVSALVNDAGYTTNTGTVTSVGATTPTGLSVSGSPITGAGTLAFSWSTGYQGYTSAEASKLGGVEAGATVGADWSVNLTNIPANITSWAGIAPSSKADDSAVVKLTGAQSIAGPKTFINDQVYIDTPSGARINITTSASAVSDIRYSNASDEPLWALRCKTSSNNFSLRHWEVGGITPTDIFEVTYSTKILSFTQTPKVGANDVWHAGNFDPSTKANTSEFASGTYTPTPVGITNVSSVTAESSAYIRVGSAVALSGRVNVVPVAASTMTQIEVEVPINSNFSGGTDATGDGAFFQGTTTTFGGAVVNSISPNTLRISFNPVNTNNHQVRYSIVYPIIP